MEGSSHLGLTPPLALPSNLVRQCWGMNAPDKRRTLYHWLKTEVKPDVALLQETHCASTDDALKWEVEWSGLATALNPDDTRHTAWFSVSSSPHTGGTAILILPRSAPKFRVSSATTSSEFNGAWTSITCAYEEHTLRLDSIYLPATPSDRVLAIDSLSNDIWSNSVPDEHIMGGIGTVLSKSGVM